MVKQLGSLPPSETALQSGDRPYLPFNLALQQHLFSNDEPEALARPLSQSPGVTIANGLLPNPHGAGVVLQAGQIIAFDHVWMRPQGEGALVVPGSKNSVTAEGEMIGEGDVVMASPNGWLKLIAKVIDATRYPWAVERCRREACRVTRVGDMAICAFSLRNPTPKLDIEDIDSNADTIFAKPAPDFY